jgi:crotonobetainyl-CoA:carnitine CoA-transferase CaiB-like acyl-CoA transferase
VLKLAAKSDVVIENFSPRVMANWGLSDEKLKQVKPDLIMLSMSAMGQGGPWKDYVAFAPTLHALSGLTHLTSFEGDAPIGPGYAYADIVAGLYAALAVLAALEFRSRTGQGQYIDLSEYEAMGTLLAPSLLDALLNDKEIQPRGHCPDDITAAPYGCYPCSGTDRWCVISVSDEEEWQSLCRVLGNPEWMKEERFATVAKRKENRKELDDLLTAWTTQHTAEDIVTLLQEAGISSGVVQNAEDLSRDPQLLARKFFVQLDHPVLGMTVSGRSPIKFEQDTTVGWKAAPQLGQDNEYVFVELLGLTESEFSSCVEKGIIG